MFGFRGRKEERQRAAVVDAMRPLDKREEVAVRLALSQCAEDIRRNHPAEAQAMPVEDLVLLAAWQAASLSAPRSFFVGVFSLSVEEGAAFCARIRAAAGAVATRQGRRSVLDGFRQLDAAPLPDRA